MNENKLREAFEERGFNTDDASRLGAFWKWIGGAINIDEFDCNDGLCECYSYQHDCLVLTDDEADMLWDEYLDNHIEECIDPELPDNLRFYFDTDAWKRDARIDGRGHCLSGWDGGEDEIDFLGVTYYIYKQ